MNDKPYQIVEPGHIVMDIKTDAEETPGQVVERLSKLSPIDYECVRESEAKKLKFRASALDKLVSKTNNKDNDEVVTNDTPYCEAVDGDELLQAITSLINKHMVLPKNSVVAITLWIISTFVYDAFRVCPKLAVISPEKRCGKSTLLDILGGLCNRSLIASNITPAAIFRSVDLWKPTLIIDEADTFLSGRNDDLIGIINSGHTKATASVIRIVGDEHIPKKFSTWSPMAFASIKGIAGTVMDRSIIISLRRRTAGEKVTRLSIDFKEDSTLIRQKLTRWGEDNFSKLKAHLIEPPEVQNDRAIDNWLPLFTIAHAIGGEWTKKVENAYFVLNSAEIEESSSTMLLQDIKEIFEKTGWIKIHSETLVEELIKLEERPWCEWRKGSPMTQNSLAKILKTFSIHSKSTRAGIPEKILKGFDLSQFLDAFTRYLPDTAIQSATVLQASNDGACSGFQSATSKGIVALSNAPQAAPSITCSTVALQNATNRKATNDEEIF